MGKRRRFLVADAIRQSRDEEFAPAQEAALAACPEADRFTEAEIEAFWAAAVYLDCSTCEVITGSLQKARIAYPPELSFDAYRLGRYIFRRWSDPAVRQAFLERSLHIDLQGLARLRRTRDVAGLGPSIDWWGAPAVLYVLRRYGMEDLVQPLLDTFTPEEAARYKALMQFGKLTLHRFLTELEPPRAPSPWEQQKLARRIRLREVQLTSMQRSLLKLSQERKDLQARLRELGRVDQPELSALAAEWAQLRAQRAEAERRHEAARAELEARHREAIARLRAEVAAAERDFSEALALRQAWLNGATGVSR